MQTTCPVPGERSRRVVSILGDLWLSAQQAQSLSVQLRVKHSPYLEQCGLRMCAKASYQQAEWNVAMLTGIRVSAKTQERMVKRVDLPEASAPETVSELTLDDGMVRVRTPKGQSSQWRQYHGLRVNGDDIGMAWYKDPAAVCAWMKALPLASIVYLLGDGHRGIWSLSAQMAFSGLTDEILDGYHLQENLYKVDAPEAVIDILSAHLWEGQLQAALTQLAELNNDSAKRFSAYLSTHAERIPNDRYYQMEGLPIGSGPVEFWVKQIDARLQITGAQWNEETLPQMLKLRCAYLNNQLDNFSSVRECRALLSIASPSQPMVNTTSEANRPTPHLAPASTHPPIYRDPPQCSAYTAKRLGGGEAAGDRREQFTQSRLAAECTA